MAANRTESQNEKKHYLPKVATAAISRITVPSVRVTMTRGASSEAFALMHLLANGAVFGAKQPVVLRAHDKVERHPMLRARLMELKGSGFTTLRDTELTRSLRAAVTGADVIFLLPRVVRFSENPREEAEVRRHNYLLFKHYALALHDYGSKGTRVVIVGRHGCLWGAICALLAAPTVPERHITAVSRLQEARARAVVADRLKPGVPATAIENAIVWGHPPSHSVGDMRSAHFDDKKIVDMMDDVRWLRENMAEEIPEQMGGKPLRLEEAWAVAACNHMADWWQGTQRCPCPCPWRYVPMIVASNGSYKVPRHMFFSFPVVITPDKEWHIVQELGVDSFTASRMRKAVEEQKRQLRHALMCLLRERASTAPPSTLPSIASTPAGTESSMLHSEASTPRKDMLPDFFAAGDVCSSTGFISKGSGYSFGHRYSLLGGEDDDDDVDVGDQPKGKGYTPHLLQQLPYDMLPALYQGQAQYPYEGYPPEQMPYGEYPPGQMPYGEYAPGQMPYGEYPPGQMPYGEYPPGQMPYGEYPTGQMPYEEYPPGQTPYEEYPPGQTPYEEYPPGQTPYEEYPPGQMPYEEYPPGQAPYEGEEMYQGQMPYEGQVPPAGQPQLAEGAYAGQVPYGDAPQEPQAPYEGQEQAQAPPVVQA